VRIGATMRRMRSIAVKGIMATALAVLPLGCVGVEGAPVTPATASSASAVATSSAGAWESQARMLGKALQDIEDAMPSIPEPPSGEKPDGTYGALIVGVDAAKRTVTIDRCQIATGEDAVSLAEQADSPEQAVRVVNQRKERLTLPVATGAPFAVFYPGEAARNVSPDDFAAMSALSFEEFAEFYSGAKQRLSSGGGWVTVTQGRVSSFVEPVGGTS
jgi:hypothetical protein